MKRAVVIFVLFLAGCPAEKPTPPKAARIAPTVTSSAGAIVYRLDFERRHQHLVDVQLAVPVEGRDRVTLMMATWTPGSYLIREFARHVEGIEAFGLDDRPVPVQKIGKNRWTITPGSSDAVRVRYRVYARELSVRTSFVDAGFGVLNGTSIFLTDVEHLDRPHEVELVVPKAWPDVATSLPNLEGRYVAANYDILVDAPIVLGRTTRFEFEVGGVMHTLVNVGDADDFDGTRAAKDAEKITRLQSDLFGVIPYPRYLFLNILAEGRGGLEHLDSTVMMASRFATRDPKLYRNWLGLLSHELFHAWNGKRLRPAVLGPFDYENEVYTEDLWFVEGITAYYDDLLVARAGLMTEKEYLAAVSRNVASVETKPGRLHQSLAAASHDAWIKFYRSDENSDNTSISYYGKGALVGFVVDAMIRETSHGRTTLDDVMREAYRRHSGSVGYSSEELLTVFEDVAGAEVRARVDALVNTTAPINYEAAFAWYGLRFKPPTPPKPGAEKGYLGVQTERRSGRLVVTKVIRGTPAYRAGLNVEDELIAFGDDRIESLERDLVGRKAESKVNILVSRRRRLIHVEVELGKPPDTTFKLDYTPRRGATEERRLKRLLSP